MECHTSARPLAPHAHSLRPGPLLLLLFPPAPILQLEDVAGKCGFGCDSALGRLFREHIGSVESTFSPIEERFVNASRGEFFQTSLDVVSGANVP
jgi:hypothetical protein